MKFLYSLFVGPNMNNRTVYLFTKDRVFSVNLLRVALVGREAKHFVLTELFFDGTEVKDLTAFWGNHYKNESYNAVFSDFEYDRRNDPAYKWNQAFWLIGGEYRIVTLSRNMEVTNVSDLVNVSNSEFEFFKNDKIYGLGYENIIGIDIAETWSNFNPVRVYVRDVTNNGKVKSFAFRNKSHSSEEFQNGKQYDYSFDSAAYLNTARSLNKTTSPHYNNYFELRTRKGRFSLFDFTNNRDFLLIGANEELLGCPPSFCHWRQFDDIIRLHDGRQLLVFREWLWNFTKPGDSIVWEEAIIANIFSRKHWQNNFRTPFRFAIRRIVAGSFTDDRKLYIFRNGTFLASEDDTIIDGLKFFNQSTRIESFFKGVPNQTFDALFYHKDTRIVYFIFDDTYWAYSMANTALVSDTFPKQIETLGLPKDFKVKSTYVDEDDTGAQTQFYFFTENRYITWNSSQFKGGRFESQELIYYCTSVNFLGCPDTAGFVCPPIPGPDSNPDSNTDSNLDSSQNPKEDKSNLWTYILILLVIIGLLVTAIVLFFVFAAKFKQNTIEAKNEPKVEKNDTIEGKPDPSKVSQIDSSKSTKFSQIDSSNPTKLSQLETSKSTTLRSTKL